MLSNILNHKTKTITSGAIILGISYFLSAVLGMIRDGILFGKFGASSQLDVYFAAFRIPDFVYNILILGGLIVAFLPLFSEYFSKSKEEAWKMTNYVLNAILFFLILISLLFIVLAPLLVRWLFPGFTKEQVDLAVPLTRLLFFSPIFFGVSNLLSGVLQYFNRFFIYSLTPILYNLGIIFGILFLTPYFGIFGVGIGVILGAFLHMLIQIPFVLKEGFSFKPIFDLKHPAIKDIFKLMIPRVFAIAAQQINLIIMTGIASTIGIGSITIFNFSNNIQSMPIGIIGTSFAVAVFPVLSRNFAENKNNDFKKNFYSTFKKILYFAIPISVLMVIFETLIIKIIIFAGKFILGSTKFGVGEINLAAACLGIFAISLFAQSLIPLLARGFFSFKDTKTPTLITIFAVILNIVLSFAFVNLLSQGGSFAEFFKSTFNFEGVGEIKVIGLPLAFSITAIFQFILLLIFFRKKIQSLN